MVSSEISNSSQPVVQPTANQTMDSREKRKRWLIAFATVVVVVFLIYLFLIIVYPSLNIGMNPQL